MESATATWQEFPDCSQARNDWEQSGKVEYIGNLIAERTCLPKEGLEKKFLQVFTGMVLNIVAASIFIPILRAAILP